MKAIVTFVQPTKNTDWVIVHCLADDGRVAQALCKRYAQVDDHVDIHKTFKDGKYTNFARIIEE